jgi:hypothetical protein
MKTWLLRVRTEGLLTGKRKLSYERASFRA